MIHGLKSMLTATVEYWETKNGKFTLRSGAPKFKSAAHEVEYLVNSVASVERA